MKLTVKSVKLLKEGTGEKGPWELWKVVDQKGVEQTTFDKSIKHLKPGTVIEVGKITLDDQERRSFKKAEIVTPAPETTKGNGSDMSKEDWERKQKIERASYEAQTAVKVILSMDPEIMDQEAKAVRDKALKWCEVKIDANMNGDLKSQLDKMPHIAGKVDEAESPPPSPDRKFDNVGEFFTACQKEGVTRKTVLEHLNIIEADVSRINTEEAWLVILEEVIKPSQQLFDEKDRAKEKATATK